MKSPYVEVAEDGQEPRQTEPTGPGTGIYEVRHDRGHRERHEVVMFAKDPFPECEECGAKVRFRVIRTAPYIFDDHDFIEGC